MSSAAHNAYESLLASFRSGAAGRPPRPSASVVPWRSGAQGAVEVFWVRRSPKLRFMGGWHAFPGGGLSRRDADLELVGAPDGVTPDQVSPAEPEPAADLPVDLVPGLLTCAVRELFEETGLLLTAATLDDSVDPSTLGRWHTARQALLAAERRPKDADVPEDADAATRGDFQGWLSDEGLQLTVDPLTFAGRWLTPPVAPMRFDNRFFLLHWPAERAVQPMIVPGELAEGEWIEAGQALDRWQRGDVIAAPPIVHLLRVLSEDGPTDGLPRLVDPKETCLGPVRHVEFRPGITLIPLQTPTLPPATHTNTYLLGHGEAVVVDPASPIAEEQDRLIGALEAWCAQGRRLKAIWLTHHHQDHIGAVERVRETFDLPVYAHAASAEPLARHGITLDGELRDGQRITLDGDPALTLRVCHTPGHTRGHLAFFDEASRSLILGDLVSSLSTIVIDPPEGDMGAYLASLEAMVDLEPSTLFPSHGPVILDAVGKLEEFHSHRLEREGQVLEAWNRGLKSAADMVAELYADVPPAVHFVAMRQIEAHLEHLRELEEI